MKKTIARTVGCLLFAAMLVTPSCIGSFTAWHKVLAWNQNVGDKYINELVFIALNVIPVYPIAGAADVLILNTVEFWTGTNPLASSSKVIEGQNGKYLVKSDEKGYDIIGLNDGSKLRLNYNDDTKTWSYEANGESGAILTFIDDTHVAVPDMNGNMKTVEVSAEGVLAYQNSTIPMLAAR